MNKLIFGLTQNELKKKGAIYTANEIFGQPELWLKTWDLIVENSLDIKKYLNKILEKQNLQIVLTGAGTSAFIGEVLEGPFQKHTNRSSRAIATTNLVTHPELYLLKNKPTLLISFARSGNSPESCKAVELAKSYCNEIYNLIITCNSEGKLALETKSKNDFVFVLPPESDDKSLAMTGSFTSMLLTGLLISRLDDISNLNDQKNKIFSYGKRVLDIYSSSLKKAASINFNRAVFLGSGLFSGIARESHLKLQELSDGKVVCKHDTFLGFRHGPKAVVNENTLVIYLFSNNKYSQKYEFDLVESVNNGRGGIYRIGVMENDISNANLDLKIILAKDNDSISEEFLTIISVLPAQIIAFYKSMELGLEPDNPSKQGVITRVVKGVKLYNYKINDVIG
ncbi:MAG: SIS domain-containing protein [Melioribacteraceae bacterium]